MNAHRKAGPVEYGGDLGRFIRSPRARAYIYGVSIPVLALLVGVGVVTDGTAGLILDVIAGVLAVGTSGLAVANTPSRGREGGGADRVGG